MQSTKNTKVVGGGSKWIQKGPVALTLGLLTMVLSGYSIQEHQSTKKTERAYQETKQALHLIGTHFNKGLQEMKHLHQFEMTKRKIYKH